MGGVGRHDYTSMQIAERRRGEDNEGRCQRACAHWCGASPRTAMHTVHSLHASSRATVGGASGGFLSRAMRPRVRAPLHTRRPRTAAARGIQTFQPRPAPPSQEFSWAVAGRSKLTLHLSEAAGTSPGFGHKIWPSAHALVAHLATRDDLAGKRVVELGCGVGLVGLGAAALGAHTVVTDRDAHVLSQAAANAELNQSTLDKAGGSAVTFRLDWRNGAALQKLLHLHGPFDLIVASDVLYSASMFPSLLQTIDGLSTIGTTATQPITTTLLAYPERDNRHAATRVDGEFVRLRCCSLTRRVAVAGHTPKGLNTLLRWQPGRAWTKLR